MILSSLKYIDAHISEDVKVDDLAEKFFFSKHHYYRLFKAITGYTLAEYVDKRRLSLACDHLRNSDSRILDVAISCGYKSHELLTRKFKKAFNMSPKQYRQSSCDIEPFELWHLIERQMVNKKLDILVEYEVVYYEERTLIGQICNNGYDDAIDSRTVGNFLNDFADHCFSLKPDGHLQFVVLSFEENEDIEYFVGFDDVDRTYDSMVLPASDYAVFKYKGLFRENIKTIISEIYKSIASSDLKLRNCNFEFVEVYDEAYLDTLEFEIHVPVE